MAHDVGFLGDVLPEDRIATDANALESHAGDLGSENAGMGVEPDAVVWPTSAEEVTTILAAADERGEAVYRDVVEYAIDHGGTPGANTASASGNVTSWNANTGTPSGRCARSRTSSIPTAP